MSNVITAAGGVVWRASRTGDLRVAVIHRPRRDDWSLPKGKLLASEPSIVGACREVREETGLDVAVQHRIGRSRYRVGSATKTVTYWAMRHVGGSFKANHEADLLRWLAPEQAVDLLTFPADRTIVEQFVARPVPDATVLLVRHAKAGKRGTWKKDDRLRPIDAHGRRQAAAIARVAALFGPRRLYAAPLVRCEQTVAPLAHDLGLKVRAAPRFADHDFERRPQRSVETLDALTRAGITVVASQGVVIPGLLDYLCPRAATRASRKGSIWALFFSDGRLITADYYERPGSV